MIMRGGMEKISLLLRLFFRGLHPSSDRDWGIGSGAGSGVHWIPSSSVAPQLSKKKRRRIAPNTK